MMTSNTENLRTRIAELEEEIARQDQASDSGRRQDQTAVQERIAALQAELESKRSALAMADAGPALQQPL